MRFRAAGLALCIVLFLLCGAWDHNRISAQGDEVSSAREKLIEAFLAVRDADLAGVPPNELAILTGNLNTALALETRAYSTGSSVDANLSITLSSQVASKARALEGDTIGQSLRVGILSYSLVFWAAAGSSFLLIESHRIVNFARRRRARRLVLSPRSER